MKLPRILVALALLFTGTACTNLYVTTINHNLPAQAKGTVWVQRVFPLDDPGAAPEKELFYAALTKTGLTRAPSMKGADWCLFYHSMLRGSRTIGYTANFVTDDMATISADRLYTRELEADLMDAPGKPPRWQARGIAVTGHLTDRDTLVMIKDAVEGFPGPTYQKRKKWR